MFGLIKSAIEKGVFDAFADQLIQRIEQRLLPIIERFNGRTTTISGRVAKQFQSMGLGGVLLQQVVEDKLQQFIERQGKNIPEAYSALVPENTQDILDGIDSEELNAALSMLESAVSKSVLNFLEKQKE